MSYAALFLLIAALGVIAYWTGKYRSLALVGGGRGIRKLHSLPSYYGMLTALWAALPCLLLLVVWSFGQEALITAVVKKHLPDRALAADATQVGLFMNDVHNVLSGSVPAEAAQEVANVLVHCGVLGILNFSPIVLHVPEDVMVNNVNLAIELENLSYFIQE